MRDVPDALMTIMIRLDRKGLLERERIGKTARLDRRRLAALQALARGHG